jgi:hypothetical protein
MTKFDIWYRGQSITAFQRPSEDWEDAARRATRRMFGRYTDVFWQSAGRTETRSGKVDFIMFRGTVTGRPIHPRRGGGTPIIAQNLSLSISPSQEVYD